MRVRGKKNRERERNRKRKKERSIWREVHSLTRERERRIEEATRVELRTKFVNKAISYFAMRVGLPTASQSHSN